MQYSRYWYLKLHALTECSDFEGLDTFARSRRSPIGYQAFVQHLVEKGHTREAIPYVVRCDSNKRVDLYVLCGDWRLAGKECKERGDKAKMEYVLSCSRHQCMLTTFTESLRKRVQIP